MAYKLERKRNGLIKHFSGLVTYQDVLKSEHEVAAHPDYSSLRYVISDYIGATYGGITDSEKADINAIRIGGHYLNPNIKYAFVIQNPSIREQLKNAVAKGEMLHATQIFDTYEQAAAWVGL